MEGTRRHRLVLLAAPIAIPETDSEGARQTCPPLQTPILSRNGA